MDFNDIKKKYNLDFDGLAKILQSRQITLTLPHLNDIPETWIPIIEESLGIASSKEIEISEVEGKALAYIDSLLEEDTRDRSKSPKLLQSENADNEEVEVSTENSIIDYELDDNPKRVRRNNNPQLNNKPKTNKLPKQKTPNKSKKRYYAFVKFVGPNNDHAFVRLLDDINQISKVNLRIGDDKNFKLAEDCSGIKKGQIIVVNIRNKKFKLASIIEKSFIGTIPSSHGHAFINWTSFEEPSIIDTVKLIPSMADEIFVGVKLLYDFNIGIFCERVERDVSPPVTGPLTLRHFLGILENKQSPDFAIIVAFKKIIEDSYFQKKILEQFKVEVDSKAYLENQETFLKFLRKWSVIDPSVLRYSNIVDAESNIIFFDAWLKRKLPIEFWEDELVGLFIEYNLHKNGYFKGKGLDKIAINNYDSNCLEIIIEQLPSYLSKGYLIENLEIYNLLTSVVDISTSFEKDELQSGINRILSDKLKFEFWLEGNKGEFIKSKALAGFGEYSSLTQERILQELDDEDFFKVLNNIKEVSNLNLIQRINDLVKTQITSTFQVISFDIESDMKSIDELAWNENTIWHHLESIDEVKEGLMDFKTSVEKSGGILVGHNIIDFDCPILEEHGISFQEKFLWDTYRMEVLLSPELKNYALITDHNAKYDARLTLNLFHNQVFRILHTSDDKLKEIECILPATVISELKSFKLKSGLNWLQKEDLIKERDSFFRPQPKVNSVIVNLKKSLLKSTSERKIIIGPDSLRNDVLAIPGINFIAKDNLELRQLDEERIVSNTILDPWLKNTLLSNINYFKTLGAKPYWGSLPLAIKIQLEKQAIDVFTLVKPIGQMDWENSNLVYITSDELFENQTYISTYTDLDVFILQPDLISVTQKRLLKEIQIDDFRNLVNDDHFWMKFSGGQSYVPLTIEECGNLQIDIPSGFSNFWIEKYQFGKYRIWGNYNWEEVLKLISFSNKYVLSINPEKFAKEQTTFVRVNFSKTASKNILRFNPESVYRSRYWVFQKELIKQSLSPEKLSVLLIQRYDELEVLENYFRSVGFYIPDRGASLARRLELLYESRKGTKIIIDVITNITKVINANYLGELNIIIDSFNLTENYYIAQNTTLIKEYRSGNLVNKSNAMEKISEDDDVANENAELVYDKKPLVKDTYLLLTLHLPQINHYRNLLNTANSDHRLMILDSRVDDFPDLSNVWNARSATMSIWPDQEQYEKDVKHAELHIISPQPITNIPFNTKEIKDILSKVFLNGKPWYEDQDPYLDLIIPGKSDELITLSTGGGKSLLFQGPALFKSAFTNRLTIVVTPLKALMEDQVSALWKKGFYGAVEYLNSDRGSDVQIIYRAMAGGELSLLFVTPERFRSRSFLNALNIRIQSDDGLEYFVFDEAHCVSQWGHEFRPDYFNCAQKVKILKQASANNTPLLLFSATVSKKIFEDFKKIFG